MTTVRFAIERLDCSSCVTHIEAICEDTPGVRKAEVHAKTRVLTIEHDGALDVVALQSNLDLEGYPVRQLSDDEEPAAAPGRAPAQQSACPTGGGSTDPVCGMRVADDSPFSIMDHGTKVVFCSKHCLERFRGNPDAFKRNGAGQQSAARLNQQAKEWTCPMHPEIVRDQPGSCPICGMALEPRSVSVDDAANPELTDMRRRFWVGSAFSVPVFILAMGGFLPGKPLNGVFSQQTAGWIEFVLATPVVLWAGWPLFVRAWQSVIRRALNMFTLIGLGVSVAYLYSVVAVIAPQVFPAAFRTADGRVESYFEAAAVITALVLLGQVLELSARSRTGAAIKALLKLAPTTARVVGSDGQERDVPLDQVKVGDRLRVRPGERVPVDGVVLEGSSSIDESMMTGESLPVGKQAESAVIGSTLNGSGTFIMRAERVGSETLLSQIVRMVSDAQRSKAPIQQVADRIAGVFVPIVVGVAVVTFVVWSLLGPSPALAYALVNAVAVLIIACPCALGLATPMSITVAVGQGATFGVLFRNAEAIEALRTVDTLVVDKTGTLTEGKPALLSVIAAAGHNEPGIVRFAASLEQGSEHPLASAIVDGARKRNIGLDPVTEFSNQPGVGITGIVGGRSVSVGNSGILTNVATEPPEILEQANKLRGEGQTVVYVAIDNGIAGILGIADPIKETTGEAIRELRANGVKIVMLTGDHEVTAQAIAQQLGLDDVVAEALPDRKADTVKRLQSDGRIVAMAGDGVNDAPALAQANVGIAMGTGTDVAMQSAGVTLVRGDLRGILRAVRLSRATMRNIRQNLFFAFIYNALGIPLAAGILYPFFGLLLNPMIAAAAMSFSSVSVIGNALRLRSVRV